MGRNLSANDAMWLNMDTPENLMIIESVMLCDRRLVLAEVRKLLGERMVSRYPVFTWRPQAGSGPVRIDRWVPAEGFRIEDHVTGHRLRGRDDQAALRRFIASQMSVPLEHDKPLWHCHVINGAALGALMIRTHHAIADGAALVEILMDFTDGEPNPTSRPYWQPGFRAAAVSKQSQDRLPAKRGEPTPRIPDPRALVRLGQRTAGAVATVVSDPVVPAAGVAALVGQGLGTVGSTADAIDSLVLSHRPQSVLSVPAQGRKVADWCQPLSLPAIKAVARSNAATVNDVLIAALAGALRRYCQAHGEHPANAITLVPVNLRPATEPLPPHLGNQFALVALELPLAAATPKGRIAAGKLRMDVIKRGPQALMAYGISHLLGTMGAVRPGAARTLQDFVGNKAIGVTTNVIGPRSQRWLTGAKLIGIMGWVPTAGEQSIGVCIFSYNNEVWVGFKTDTAAIADVAKLTRAFAAEVEDLIATTLVAGTAPAILASQGQPVPEEQTSENGTAAEQPGPSENTN